VFDYAKYYDMENYLFGEVSPRYGSRETLSTFDFFCIVIWKANRSKSKVASRLLGKKHRDLDAAVRALVQDIAKAPDPKARLEALIDKWRFRLPMASAILTVLYPNEFTVYDVRVCNTLGDFEDAQHKTNFQTLWQRYVQYTETVKNAVPGKQSLREKDRYLWGKSFATQLKNDIAESFRTTRR